MEVFFPPHLPSSAVNDVYLRQDFATGQGSEMRQITELVRSVPVVKAFIRTGFWKRFRHSVTLMVAPRATGATLTRFLRRPSQADALRGPVCSFLRRNGTREALRILVLGCSDGSEAYTIASVLRHGSADVEFSIHAVDINPNVIQKAESAAYTHREISGPGLPDTFVQSTFDLVDGVFLVKPEIRSRVSFGVADILDPNLTEALGKADMVFAQNVLINMRPRAARRGFRSVQSLLKQRSVLFIDGMDLGLRTKLTRQFGLRPLAYKLEEIHHEAVRERSTPAQYFYSTLEPLSRDRPDWERRYATIFLRDDA